MVDFADDSLDKEFPLGDGTADTEGIVVCPYCGEPNEIGIDAGGGTIQEKFVLRRFAAQKRISCV